MHRAAPRIKPYRILTLAVVVSLVVVASTTLFSGSAKAAITSAFSSRFSANVNGSILLRGNTNLVCPAAATGCIDGQNGVAGSATDSLNNNGYVMQYYDTDSDPATFNESNATITTPAGSTVLFAGLYWSADPTAGTSGAAAPSRADAGKVLFRTPSTGYAPVTDNTLYTDTSINAYQGFADVTSLVAGAGNGVYSVANIQSGTGKDRYAGWALAIAYQNPAEDMHSLRIFDGFGVVSSSSTQVVIPVSGFQTPHTGTVHAKIGTIVYEGDLGKTGDTLQLNSQSMSDAVNPANNFFNSTVSENGALVNSGRDPGNRNLMGVDIDQFDASGKLANDATSAGLTLTTAAGGETFYPGVVTFTTDLYAPQLTFTTTPTDLNGGDVLPGDIIEYKIKVRNDGTDTADNVDLSDAIPTHTTYVPGSLTVAGTSTTDGSGDDTAQFGSGTASWSVGSLPYQSDTYVTFRVRVDNDAPAGYQIVDVSNVGYVAHYTAMPVTGVGDTSTVTVQQPHADLAATLTVNPTAVQRAASPNAIGYTATVTNNGTDLEPAASAALTLPTGVTAGTLPAGCTLAGPVVTCAMGPLVSGSLATVVIPATADATAAATAVASLHVSGAGLDSVPADDDATAALLVDSAPRATADTATAASGSPVIIPVRDNDSDPDDPNSALLVTIATPPTHGQAVANANGTVTYTPAAGWRGDDTLTYQLDDQHGGTDTATVTVSTADAAPVASDDLAATVPGAALDIDVLANDHDANNDGLTVSAVTQPPAGAGTVSIGNNAVHYVPTASFAGRTTFTYTVSDGHGGTDTAHVSVDVADAAPVASADVANAPYRGTVAVDVLGNDTDPNNDTLAIDSVGTPDHGTASITSGRITYVAPAGFSGDATFSYVVSDGNGGTATGHVTVTVADAPPTAAPESVHTAYGTAVRLDVVADATDPNHDPLHVSGVTTPAHGSVTRNADGSLTYAPDALFSGSDHFDYTIDDGRGGTDTATVTVLVTDGDPTARPDSATVSAGVPSTVDLTANDTDPYGEPLTVTVDTPPAHGTVTVADGVATYTPAAGFTGTDTFHYTVHDQHTGSAGATVTLAVVNLAPDARPDAINTDTDTAVVISPLANDTDPNGDRLSLIGSTAPAHGTVGRQPAGTLVYTPAAGFTGIDTFTYTVADPSGASATAVVTVTVGNAPPIAVDDRFLVQPGVPATLPVLANDTDPNTGQTLSVASATRPAKGTATVTNGKLIYTPNAGASGTDTFDYVVTDDLGATDTGTVVVTIDGKPVPAADLASTASGTAVAIPVTGNDTDPEGQALTVVAASDPAHGIVAVVNNQVRYTPNAGFIGADTFTYTVRDTAGNTATGTVTVNVADAKPIVAPDASAVSAGKPVDIDVLGNDTDPNTGQKLTLSSVGTPAHGTATIVNGQVHYVPAAGFTGQDTFTYAVSDGHGGTATGTVSVTVSGAAPVAVPDQRTTPYQHAVTVPVLDNDLAPGSALTLTTVSTPDHGTAVIVNGRIVYTPPAKFSGVATFGYTATDANGTKVSAAVTITVGSPPVLPDKSVRGKPGAAVSISLPATDANGRRITILSVGKPAHGTARLNPDGTVTYTPEPGFAGADSFSYEAMDADGNLAEATVKVTVPGANKAPAAVDDNYRVATGHSVVIKPALNDTDPNGDKLTVTHIGRPRHGTAVLNANGTVTYKPAGSYAGGADSFTYLINDGHGGTSLATVRIRVTAAGASTGGGTGGGKLAKTGGNVVSVLTSGGIALVVGLVLYVLSLRQDSLVPTALLAAVRGNGPGRHRPGRHR